MAAALLFAAVGRAQAPSHADGQPGASATFRQYCVTCHNAKLKTAGIVIDPAEAGQAGQNAELWEKVVQKLRTRGMPPAGMPRPDDATYDRTATYLETALDQAAAAHPHPGDLPYLHRLTRTEYQNAVRDLLGVDHLPKEMDYSLLLPADNSSSEFDNIADLLFISPVIMQRYLEAARKISRLAVGDPNIPVMVNIHRLPVQLPQDARVEDLPFGTRGGLAVDSYFPLDADYVFKVEMAGYARIPEQVEITVDGERKELAPSAEARGRAAGTNRWSFACR